MLLRTGRNWQLRGSQKRGFKGHHGVRLGNLGSVRGLPHFKKYLRAFFSPK